MAGAVGVALVLAGCGSSGEPTNTGSEVGPSPLAVISPDFKNGGTIPRRFTCDGGGARPTLGWAGVPANAVEVAVLVGDPDAPGGTFVHWTVWGLPRTAKGVGPDALPAGAIQGANSSGGTGWTPPCPPKGAKPHQYIFGVYALRKRITFRAGEDPAHVVPAVRAAAIGSGSLTARYGR
ncbi:MAG TPA: YbhB/YbcL family Raf kinase inhibitor-like protein [Thermoleophilaceae bacterium]